MKRRIDCFISAPSHLMIQHSTFNIKQLVSENHHFMKIVPYSCGQPINHNQESRRPDKWTKIQKMYKNH